jgi:hypothetical protein
MQPCERSGAAKNPEWRVPPVAPWSGSYRELPAAADVEYNVQYNIVFKADGVIEGSGSSQEGTFTIQGAYNSQTGAVAWRQTAGACPVWYNPCAKYGEKVEAEFCGELSNFTDQGPVRITGTFLTDFGRYCAVNIVCPATVITTTTAVEALPTLLTPNVKLTGRWMPITDKLEKSSSFIERRMQRTRTIDSDTWPATYDKEEEEDDEV